MSEEQVDATEFSSEDIRLFLNGFSEAIHSLNRDAGWWSDPNTGDPLDHDQLFVASKLLLIHSEISEAVEAHRKGLMDDKLPHREGLEVELADALIRIFDLAGAVCDDIGGAVVEKLLFNMKRADHKVENRVKQGGKAY